MKSFFYSLLCAACLSSAGTASAQTKPAPKPRPVAPVVADVVYQVGQVLPTPRPVARVQAEFQRCRQVGATAAGLGREIRAVASGPLNLRF